MTLRNTSCSCYRSRVRSFAIEAVVQVDTSRRTRISTQRGCTTQRARASRARPTVQRERANVPALLYVGWRAMALDDPVSFELPARRHTTDLLDRPAGPTRSVETTW